MHDSITYGKQDVIRYKEQRNIIAKCVIENGISKAIIDDMIHRISSKDYPSFKQIKRVSEIIESGNYTFEKGFIPDR